MPTFSYKGYDFDVDHTPTEAEFSQMSAYVDTLPPKTISPIKETPKESSWYEENVPEPLKNAIGGVESIGRSIVNLPQMAYGAGIDLVGKTVPKNLQQDYQELAAESLDKFPHVKPFTKAGELADEMLGTAFKTVARAPGAAVQAALQGSGQTGGKELINDPTAIGPAISEVPMTLAALLSAGKAVPGQVKGLAQFAKNPTGKVAPTAPSADAIKLQEMRAKAAQAPKEMPKVQEELDLGQPNQYGHRPSEFTLDENGIPIRRNASLEAQETVRQGDLFSLENQATELRNDVLNRAEPQTEGFPSDHKYLKAQEEELAYQQKAKQDALQFEEPVVEPTQRSVEVEKPWNQSSFAKSQRGSIGSFGKDPFETFSENLRKEVPDATAEEIKQLWEDKQRESASSISTQKEATAKSEAVRSLTGLDPKYTGEVWSPEKAVEVFSTTPDIAPKNRSVLKEQLASSGRLQRDLINHPTVTWAYNLTNKAIENARLHARKVLDDVGTGVIPQIRKNVMLMKGGAKEMRELMKWRYANEGTGTALPETFSKSAKAINDSLNKADEQLLAKMNEVLVKDGKKPITALDNHMVHYWSGPYRAYIYVKTASGGSRLGFFVSEKSMADAQKAMNWIKKNVPNIDLEKTKDVSFVKADARGRSSMFDHLLDISNNTDPSVAEALQAFKERVQTAQSKHLGEHFRQERRTGVEGFEGNKPWMSEARNYADALDTIRTKYDAGYQWIAAQEIKQQMEPVLKAQQDGKISVGNALAFSQKYVDHALGKNIDVSPITKMADYLEDISPRAFGTTRRGANEIQNVFSKITLPYLLALKGTQAVQSVLQVGQATIPKMLQNADVWKGDYKNIPVALAHGSMDGMFQLANTLTMGKFEGLTRDLLKAGGKDLSDTSLAIQQAIKDNDIARISLSDTGMSKEGGFAKSHANQMAEALLNAPMNLFEGPTRTWAFSSYVRQAVKDGFKIEDAIQLAKEQMDTMVNYNPEAGSMGLANLGVVGKEARGLHTFMINYYTQLANYIKYAKESKNPVPLLAYLGITFTLGGATGMIGADLADWLLDQVKSAMQGSKHDNPALQKFTLRKWMLDNLPESMSVGPLSTSTDLGLYGSFTTKVIDPDRSFLDNMFPKTVASLQIAKGISNLPKLANEDITQHEKGAIIESVSPKFLTQAIRNRFQNKDGVVYDPNAERAGLPMYQRTEKEQKISKYGFGVRSLPETLAQEESVALSRGQKNVSDSQKKQLEKLDGLLVAGWKAGDNMTEFQKQAIGRQLGNLIYTWKVDGDTINSRLEKLAQDFGIPNDTLRKMINVKDVNYSNVDKFKDLNESYNRQMERQQRYGR